MKLISVYPSGDTWRKKNRAHDAPGEGGYNLRPRLIVYVRPFLYAFNGSLGTLL